MITSGGRKLGLFESGGLKPGRYISGSGLKLGLSGLVGRKGRVGL